MLIDKLRAMQEKIPQEETIKTATVRTKTKAKQTT